MQFRVKLSEEDRAAEFHPVRYSTKIMKRPLIVRRRMAWKLKNLEISASIAEILDWQENAHTHGGEDKAVVGALE